MKHRLVSVYDKKAAEHRGVMVERTRESAIRNFQTAVRNNDSMLSKYPEDYQLRELGTIDTETGMIEPYVAPHPICEALDCLRAPAEGPSLELATAEVN